MLSGHSRYPPLSPVESQRCPCISVLSHYCPHHAGASCTTQERRVTMGNVALLSRGRQRPGHRSLCKHHSGDRPSAEADCLVSSTLLNSSTTRTSEAPTIVKKKKNVFCSGCAGGKVLRAVDGCAFDAAGLAFALILLRAPLPQSLFIGVALCPRAERTTWS